MTWVPWIAIVASLVGGGMMGAVITALINYRRNKRQPVPYVTSFLVAEPQDLGFEDWPTELADILQTEGLFIGTIGLTNLGNQDLPKFAFGVTLNSSDKVRLVKPQTHDRHHKVTTHVDFNDPKSELDFVLEPFNREESYLIHLLVQSPDLYPQAMKISTPHPIKLVNLIASIGELQRVPSNVVRE